MVSYGIFGKRETTTFLIILVLLFPCWWIVCSLWCLVGSNIGVITGIVNMRFKFALLLISFNHFCLYYVFRFSLSNVVSVQAMVFNKILRFKKKTYKGMDFIEGPPQSKGKDVILVVAEQAYPKLLILTTSLNSINSSKVNSSLVNTFGTLSSMI